MDYRGRPELLRELNVSLLLDLVRERGPLSRPELAAASGLSLPTVNARVRTLLEAGYVRESGQTESRGGRPARLLEFNGEFGHVAGIDVGGFRVTVAVADLAGRLISFERRPLGEWVDGERVMEVARTTLGEALAARSPNAGDLMAVGLSTPGLVDPATGSVDFVPNIPGWSEIEPAQQFERMTGTPVVVENDVNAAVEGERWRGVARGVQDVVFVSVGRGIGAGILIGGRLYRGLGGAAGEIGLQREFDDDEPLDGFFGPFERRASELGVIRRYREVAGTGADIGARSIFEAAEAGDGPARQVVDEASSLLAGGLVNACAVLAPELLVLGGHAARVGEKLVASVRGRLEHALPAPPRVALSELGDRAPVIGAVRLALEAANEKEFALSSARASGRAAGAGA